jgi:hypothetical protein
MIVDRRYRHRGGLKPTRNDKLFLSAALGLCVGCTVVFGVLFDASGAAWAYLTELFGMLLICIFGLWEFGRWRVRRKNPLPKE